MSIVDEGALNPALTRARARIFAEKCLTPAGRHNLWEMAFCGKADMYLAFGNDDLQGRRGYGSSSKEWLLGTNK